MNQSMADLLPVVLEQLNLSKVRGELTVHSPIDGSVLGSAPQDTAADLEAKISAAGVAFRAWREVPAPRRGELVRLFGEELRANKQALGTLVTMECGKLLQEGLGEVQEMIDICDFAVGLSRQLYGLTMPSERPGHTMRETWQPLGPVAVISAFNFPVAVWAWNAAIALVCGDPVIWKPSEKTPLTALACTELLRRAAARFGDAPDDIAHLAIGGADIGEVLVRHPGIALVSATGSTRMGRAVGPLVAERFGRCLLELGGNNAMIVTPSADLDMAVRAILFSAVGTTGQRCTTLRRLIVHRDVRAELMARLQDAYTQISIGNPLEDGVLVGPLIDEPAFDAMQVLLDSLRDGGRPVTGGDRVQVADCEHGYYVQPALVEMESQDALVRTETFAPVLYVLQYDTLEEAIALHNEVPQGLSSCIFTRDVLEAETFLSAAGSDCGIANVNIGPSGAEIGGAFGGEKETGGGRESGSDAWKAYMRRQTVTVNYSTELPLAQGIEFGAGDG
ncbi:MAG: aldehyde dehydrogenase family protein [Halieaceae bacterium]|nr:aldehyde dehydrogenase family protein [Halieaceae bacterium]